MCQYVTVLAIKNNFYLFISLETSIATIVLCLIGSDYRRPGTWC
jgi:hypothetical protein